MYDILNTTTNARLLGPNCPGLISPGKSNVGIMPHEITKEGSVGVFLDLNFNISQFMS